MRANTNFSAAAVGAAVLLFSPFAHGSPAAPLSAAASKVSSAAASASGVILDTAAQSSLFHDYPPTLNLNPGSNAGEADAASGGAQAQSGDPQLQSLSAQVSGSCNTASNRQCWSKGYDIRTDYDQATPPGVTRKYTFNVEQIKNWKGPDGVVKPLVMLVNGQFPGPVIKGNWGDTFEITVNNKMPSDGTSIHWHGLRMWNNNINDGVPGVTECPIAPGSSKVYTFKATTYGTTWYHSHYSNQYGNGVTGSIVINGPSSSNWDIDLGAFPITDYYYKDVAQLYAIAEKGPPPASDNILFNGKNVNPKGSGGAYQVVELQKGKKHLLRLINPSVEHSWQFNIVGHRMTVIATDMVPVQPQTVNTVFLGLGQRADIIIEAEKPVANYWMNITIFQENLCGRTNVAYPASIMRYKGAPLKNPTTRGAPIQNVGCLDNLNYLPIVARNVDTSTFQNNKNTQLPMDFVVQQDQTIFWRIRNESIKVNWNKPVLGYTMSGSDKTGNYPAQENLINVPGKNTWSFWVINNNNLLNHPMHLHGHDFYVMGRSYPNAGEYNSTFASQLQTRNPTRRDVTMAPANGWLVLAYKNDNPGAWLFHCHISWHVAGGMSVDFNERVSEQNALITPQQKAQYQQQCAKWNQYVTANGNKQTDSGLRIRQISEDEAMKMVL